MWFLITIVGPAIAGSLGPGRIASEAHFNGVFGGVDGDRQVGPTIVIKNQIDSTKLLILHCLKSLDKSYHGPQF